MGAVVWQLVFWLSASVIVAAGVIVALAALEAKQWPHDRSRHGAWEE